MPCCCSSLMSVFFLLYRPWQSWAKTILGLENKWLCLRWFSGEWVSFCRSKMGIYLVPIRFFFWIWSWFPHYSDQVAIFCHTVSCCQWTLKTMKWSDDRKLAFLSKWCLRLYLVIQALNPRVKILSRIRTVNFVCYYLTELIFTSYSNSTS